MNSNEPVLARNIKCIVSCLNSNDEPDLCFVIVKATADQIEAGEHYAIAKNYFEDDGFECHLCYDEDCSAGNVMLPLFHWETAITIKIA